MNNPDKPYANYFDELGLIKPQACLDITYRLWYASFKRRLRSIEREHGKLSLREKELLLSMDKLS